MAESVLVALSGGVDSSVAAALLVEAGHEVVGVTMKLHGSPVSAGGGGCCTVDDADDARVVAARLGIPYYVIDLTAVFERSVVEPYVDAHREGLTPNPCVECNRHVKFDELVARADMLGIDRVATGHHARLVDGRLVRGADANKDQSYVLACVDPVLLPRLAFPVGDMSKHAVREVATALGLRTASKAESMEACFLPEGRAPFLATRIDLEDGDVIDAAGHVVGLHGGAARYTIGQRRGLGLALGRPVYVHAVDVPTNTVRVAPDPPTCRGFAGTLTVWYGEAPTAWVDVTVQTSAHGRPTAARVRHVPGEDRAEITCSAPVPSPAPGQLAVFYAGDTVLGSAVVTAPDSDDPARRDLPDPRPNR
ncbi:MAG: tRNA 2-thiouridine(34) synthase MnmA [Acidimicrobiia bacterium]|nr:tRNA 2-thiouridine(34) synthase MnmA [Acidimicrobiia bacterium]